MPDPYCLAFVLCDGVHQDPQTGKFTLNGIFQALRAKQLPLEARFWVYFALTDGLGRAAIRLEVVHAEQGLAPEALTEPIVVLEHEIEFPDKIAVVEGAVAIRESLPSAGTYLVELYANNVPMMARRLVVLGPRTGS